MMADMCYMGTRLAERGWNVVYGGSGKGVMGAVAAGVVAVGGKAVGVLPAKIHALGYHREQFDIEVVEDMVQRKARFWSCDAFLCLPGGVGTMDELFEIWTLIKLGYAPRRPIVVFNWKGFYNPLKEQLFNMNRYGTMPMDRVDMAQFTDNLELAVTLLGDAE
jgi:uncharacterized protein (TIGR00730 family)